MANPKHRHSHTRGAKRRTHYTFKEAAVSTCEHCGQPKMPHRVCPHCGYYKNRPVVTAKTK